MNHLPPFGVFERVPVRPEPDPEFERKLVAIAGVLPDLNTAIDCLTLLRHIDAAAKVMPTHPVHFNPATAVDPWDFQRVQAADLAYHFAICGFDLVEVIVALGAVTTWVRG